jgi:hypothetical protein
MTIQILRKKVFGLFLTHPLCTDIKQEWPFSEPTQSNDYVIFEWSQFEIEHKFLRDITTRHDFRFNFC